MKSSVTIRIFGVIGIILWSGTVILRGTTFSDMSTYNFILGITPNIGAAWFVLYLYTLFKIKCTIKDIFIVSVVIWIISLCSEIIHDMFFNSIFDLNDIIATSIALIVSYVVIYFNEKHMSIG